MSIAVAAVTHKEYAIPVDPLYIPLMAGSALMGEVPVGYVRDDTGDNISASNRTYCELTGLYWAWKNLDADYTGICHYRRYFASAASRRQILGMTEAEGLMERAGVLLPRPRRYYIESNYSQYVHAHHAEDLDRTREIVAFRHPDYIDAFERRMRMRSGHRFNMFIMKREILDRYCTWLFDILFELEKQLDISKYNEKDKRVFGYVAERLLDVWLDKNGISYIETAYIMTEKEHLLLKAAGLLGRKIRAMVKRS